MSLSSLTRKVHGFTLISTLVAVVIATIAMVGILKMFSTQSKSMVNIASRHALEEISSNIQMILGNENLCAGSFRDASDALITYVPATSTTADVEKIKFGSDVLLAKDQVLEAGLKIIRMQILGTGVASDTFIQGGTNYNRHYLKFEIEAEKSSANLGKNSITKRFYWIALVNPGNNKIESCQAASNTADVSGGRPKVLLVEHIETSKQGGTSVAGAWTKRTFNTISLDEGGVVNSLAANVLTLAPATYHCRIYSYHFGSGVLSKTRLVVDGAVQAQSTTPAENNWNTNNCIIETAFTLSAPKQVWLEYFVPIAKNYEALGSLNCTSSVNCVAANFNTAGPYKFAMFRCDVWK